MDQVIIDFFHQTIGTFKNGKSPPIFPGPQPISIERKHFQTLKNDLYVVCEKTDGVRHALICTMFKGKKVCALLNRALEVKPIQINFPKNACNGTVLDGELVDGTFMVYDAMMVYGESVLTLNFLERLEKISYFISGILKLKKDPLKIKLKKFFVKNDIQELNDDYIPTLS